MLRAGQYAQADSRPIDRWELYGGPGGGGLAAGAKTGGGRLAFIRPLGQTLRDALRRTFGESLGPKT